MTTLKLTERLRQRNSTLTCSHVSILTQTKKTRRTGRTQALEWTFQKLTMSEICIHLMTLSCLTTDVKRTKRSKGPNASACVRTSYTCISPIVCRQVASEGLVGRSNRRNREDLSATVGLKEGMLVFLLFKPVMDMTQSQQKDFLRYQKKLLKHLQVEKTD